MGKAELALLAFVTVLAAGLLIGGIWLAASAIVAVALLGWMLQR